MKEVTDSEKAFIDRLLKLSHNARELTDPEKEKVWKLRLAHFFPDFDNPLIYKKNLIRIF